MSMDQNLARASRCDVVIISIHYLVGSHVLLNSSLFGCMVSCYDVLMLLNSHSLALKSRIA
jgi:hypothetical protein